MCSRIVEQCQAGPGARLCCLTLALFLTPHWAGGAENLALVVNGDSWMSRSVANHYISLREIPAAHVVQLTGLPDLERIDVERFRHQILRPVLNTLRQRQRLALARAILRDPAILILDEPTSAVDAQSQMVFYESLQDFTRGRTTLLVTHYVSPILLETITRIAVMDRGQLIAVGRHEDILQTCPVYQRLFRARSGSRAA